MWTYWLVIEAEEAEAEITQGEQPEGAEPGTAPHQQDPLDDGGDESGPQAGRGVSAASGADALGDPMRYVLVCRDTEKTTLPHPPTPLPLLLQVRLRVPGP